MGTVGQEILLEPSFEGQVASIVGALPSPRGAAFSLARPWKLPAGHADSFHRRRHSRIRVHVPVEISLLRPDGSPYDTGTGVIRDLSCSGVLLGDVLLPRGRLLARCFQVELHPSPRTSGLPGIVGRVLRTFSLGIPGFGVEFLRPELGREESFRRMA